MESLKQRRKAIASVLMSPMLLVAACAASSEGSAEQVAGVPATRKAARPVVDTAPPLGCDYPSTSYEKWCHSIDISRKRIRYLLFRASPSTPDTMIYDLGGPGLSNLSRISADYDQAATAASARHLNLLVIDEPWVTAPYIDACRKALSVYLQNSSSRYPKSAALSVITTVQKNCLADNTAGTFTAASYRAAVAGIENRESLKVERLEGYSFASVRAAYLGSTHPDLIAAVSTPFPVGASAADFYSAVLRSNSSKAASTGRWDIDSAAAYYQATGTSRKDVDVPTAARAWWQADGEGTVSLSRVGYYSETCTALKDWPGLLASWQNGQSRLAPYASVHAVCSKAHAASDLKLPQKTCFAVLKSDANTPWVTSDLTRRARINVMHSGIHGKVGIPACQ